MPEPTPEIEAVVKALARLTLTKPDGTTCPLLSALAVGIADYREDQRHVFEAIERIAQVAIEAVLLKPSEGLRAAVASEVLTCFVGGSSGLDEIAAAIAHDHAAAALRAAGRHILGDEP